MILPTITSSKCQRDIWRAQTHHCTKYCRNRSLFAEILRFFEFSRWPLPPSWIFEIAKFYWLLGSRGWRRISVPNFVKIGQLVVKILSFFQFFKMALGFVWGIFGQRTVSTSGLYHSAEFGYDRCSSFYNMNISIFGMFGWKIPIHDPKIGVWGQYDPLNGLQYQQKPKMAHPCVGPRHLSH